MKITIRKMYKIKGRGNWCVTDEVNATKHLFKSKKEAEAYAKEIYGHVQKWEN